MANQLHRGTLTRNQKQCIVIYRTMIDEDNRDLDPNHCLVAVPGDIPAPLSQHLIDKTMTAEAQTHRDLWKVFHASDDNKNYQDGMSFLEALYHHRVIFKVPTREVMMNIRPDLNVALSEVNASIRAEEAEVMRNKAMMGRDEYEKFVPYTESGRTHMNTQAGETIHEGINQRIAKTMDPLAGLESISSIVPMGLHEPELEAKLLRQEADYYKDLVESNENRANALDKSAPEGVVEKRSSSANSNKPRSTKSRSAAKTKTPVRARTKAKSAPAKRKTVKSTK